MKNHSMSEAEQHYIDTSTDPVKARLALYMALTYNTCEPSWILDHCHWGISYNSQSVFEPINGIREYRDYLIPKLRTLSRVDVHRRARFELGYDPSGRPCTIGRQRQGKFSYSLGEKVLWMDITPDDKGYFKSICAVTVIPDPCTTTGIGIVPGIPEEQIALESAYRPHKIPERLELLFKVFINDPVTNLDDAMTANTKTAISDLPHADMEIISTGVYAEYEIEQCQKYHVVALPTLVVEHDGELVMRLEGVLPPDKIRERLAEYVFQLRLLASKP